MIYRYVVYSVLIGAPRAQSTLETQRKVNETGAVYKCTFDKSAIGHCAPFVFDSWGNTNGAYDQYAYNNEKKDYQWLGASMDGSASDTDKFVASFQLILYLFLFFPLYIRKHLMLRNLYFLLYVNRFVHHD